MYMILIFCFILLIYLIICSIRNHLVYNFFGKILEEDSEIARKKIYAGEFTGDKFHPRYDSLPSQTYLVFNPFIWNFNKLVKPIE